MLMYPEVQEKLFMIWKPIEHQEDKHSTSVEGQDHCHKITKKGKNTWQLSRKHSYQKVNRDNQPGTLKSCPTNKIKDMTPSEASVS